MVNLTQREDPEGDDFTGRGTRHGTAVASLIFGAYPESKGAIARQCRCISLPIFDNRLGADTASGSTLAHAIRLARKMGAHIINISAGQPDVRAAADPELAEAVQECVRSNVLIIAAAGDGGCDNPQIPANLPGVLAVEGRNATELVDPRRGSSDCISAPTRYRVAQAGGDLSEEHGSSFACAMVTGAAALFALYHQGMGKSFSAQRIRHDLSSALRSQESPSIIGDFEKVIMSHTRVSIRQSTHLSQVGGPATGEKGANDRHITEMDGGGAGADRSTFRGEWRLNDHSERVRQKFADIEAERFGKTRVDLPGGRFLDVADLHYEDDGHVGMRLVPAADGDGKGSECALLDGVLRDALGVSNSDEIYALLSYIHPEEHHMNVAELQRRSKLYLGQRHIGAYLGSGRTSHALERRSQWRGERQSSMQLNVDRHPANVHVVELAGVPPAILARNARMVDAVIAGRARVPIRPDTVNCRTFELRSILMYYRDLLQNAAYLEDFDWYTNCSVHKMIVLNVALNLPHNPTSFAEILGDQDGKLWQHFIDAYEQEFGIRWSDSMETSFVPLWKLSGLTNAEVHPWSEHEYHTYFAASRELRTDSYKGTLPLDPGQGMAWVPETLGDVLQAFVDMYCPRAQAGDVAATGCWLLLRHVLFQQVGMPHQKFFDAVTPLLARCVVMTANDLPDLDREKLLDNLETDVMQWLIEVEGLETQQDDALKAAIQSIGHLARDLNQNDEAALQLDSGVHGVIANLRYASGMEDTRHGLFASPAIFHKLALGIHPTNPHVSFRTVCTAIDSADVQMVPDSNPEPTMHATMEGLQMSYENQRFRDQVSGPSGTSITAATAVPVVGPIVPDDIESAAEEQAKTTPPAGQLIYALGSVGYDFPTAARRLSFQQRLAGHTEDPARLLDHLDAFPADAAALEWTLNIDGMPIYILRPEGPFARDTYDVLRGFLRDQIDDGAERISLSGVVTGSFLHSSGFPIPIVNPDTRGMYSWTTSALLESLHSTEETGGNNDDPSSAHLLHHSMTNFLERVYYEIRNLGREPWERALNYAATNAFEVERVFEAAISQNMELDSINVEPSPLTPAGSNHWDVRLVFFFPERAQQSVRRAYRFTVTVDDVVPATVGPMRAWYVR